MKKRKLVYLMATSVFALSLSSCKENDYFSKEFDVVMPEKDAKATKDYNLSDPDARQKVKDIAAPKRDNIKKDFFNKYAALMLTNKQDFINDEKHSLIKSKKIYDFKNNSRYSYIYSCELENDKVTSYLTVETKAYYTDKYTLNTTITLSDCEFHLNTSTKKASGTVNITTTHEESLDHLNGKYDYLIYPYISQSSGVVSANDDLSYVYFTMDNYNVIEENGLLTYYSNVLKGDSYTVTETSKYDYIDHSILADKYDSKDYIEYDEDALSREVYGVNGLTLFDGAFIMVLLEGSETFRSWFTIKDVE